MLGVFRDVGDALDRRRAGSNHRDALVTELVQIPVGVSARVAVVPTTGVKGVPFVTVDPGNSGQLGPVQGTVGHHHVASAQEVITIGADQPPALFLAPSDLPDQGLKEGAAVQIVLFADAARVREDFRREGILLFRQVSSLLEQRQINVRLDVALRARIAVPVPGAAEVAALLDDAKVLNARLAQACAREQTAEAAADDHNLQRLVQRFAGEAGVNVRIIYIAAEVPLDLNVLFVTVATDAFVAFLAVLGPEGIGVETEVLSTAIGGSNTGSITHWKLPTRGGCARRL